MIKVLIGIQARSGSTRLPNKAFSLIAGRTLLDRVVESCRVASKYIQRRGKADVHVAILTPEGDPIAKDFATRAEIVEGSEFDVLSRYVKAARKYGASYVVRVTGDCPMLPPPTVEGMVSLALKYHYDYVSNVDERYRTSIDGVDCEVIGTELLRWADTHAKDPADREHVTTIIRRVRPPFARMGFVCSAIDLSSIKLSVDTQDDLDRVRSYFDAGFNKWQGALEVYGPGSVHRL